MAKVKVNRHRWFLTWSKTHGIPYRELEVIDGNDGGRRKTLYLSNDDGGTPGGTPPSSGPDALPSGVIVNEWYPKSLCVLQDRHNIRLTDASVANLRTPLAPGDWYVSCQKGVRQPRYYPNFPVDGSLIREQDGGGKVEVEV